MIVSNILFPAWLLLLSRAIESASSIRVLVVDDDSAYRQLVGLLLRRHGFEVHSADGGEAALPLALDADVALVDMVMPGMDGLATIAALQRENPELRFIASSGCEAEHFRAGLDRLGTERFLAKPFAFEYLVEIIEQTVACVAV